MSEQEDIAKVYIGTFAARDDVYNAWSGSHWYLKREPLTPEVIIRAFKTKIGVGAYTQTPDGKTHVAAVDFDSEDGWQRARALRDVMDSHGAFAYIEPSRRGAHLFSVLDRQLPPRIVRRAMRGFLAEALIPDDDPKVEIRPGFDNIKPDGFGAALRMPTMPHPKTGKRYPLCGPDDQPLGANLADILLRVEWASFRAFEEMAAKTPPKVSSLDASYRLPQADWPTDPDATASGLLMSLWGVRRASPGRSTNCPAHDDVMASLSILPDDQRAVCHAPGCLLNNNERGRGTNELRRLAPSANVAPAG